MVAEKFRCPGRCDMDALSGLVTVTAPTSDAVSVIHSRRPPTPAAHPSALRAVSRLPDYLCPYLVEGAGSLHPVPGR